MAVEIDIEYEGGLHCTATHGPSGQSITTDAPVDNGGKGEFFSPTDLVATAQATCLMTIMGLVARDNSLDLTGMRARITKEMAADTPRRISSLTVTIAMPEGSHFSKADRARLENAGKVCPVKQSLHPDMDVIIDFVYPD